MFYEETFEKLSTIFQPLLENSVVFFKCQVSWDQGRRIKGFVATVLEDEALSFPAGAPGAELVLV